jgi:hypothetical protein
VRVDRESAGVPANLLDWPMSECMSRMPSISSVRLVVCSFKGIHRITSTDAIFFGSAGRHQTTRVHEPWRDSVELLQSACEP